MGWCAASVRFAGGQKPGGAGEAHRGAGTGGEVRGVQDGRRAAHQEEVQGLLPEERGYAIKDLFPHLLMTHQKRLISIKSIHC